MVLLPWTPPYDWAWMVGFLQARAVAGVERFHDGGYSRSFGVEGHRGLIHLAPDEEAQGLRVSLSPGLQPVVEICYARIGQLFDLACDPRQVARTLGDLPRVAAPLHQLAHPPIPAPHHLLPPPGTAPPQPLRLFLRRPLTPPAVAFLAPAAPLPPTHNTLVAASTRPLPHNTPPA
ncbi:AlkA N-terminal domain-containing protein, partial [Klebsiella pneumoniae]|uniref:AlkA N-terminal domain-containing protein n=1 Tax=Klebsiella pneumoniae TaxID=573 RepID=UPI00281150F3